MDKEGGILGTSQTKELTEVEKIQINLDLSDIWRDQIPLTRDLHGEGVIHLYPADLTFFPDRRRIFKMHQEGHP